MAHMARPLPHHPQVGLPHVRADHLQQRRALLAEPCEEALQSRDPAVPPDPQQPPSARVQLVHQGQVAMPALPRDLVHRRSVAIPSRETRSRPHATAIPTARWTRSQLTPKTSAVSFHDSRRAQLARNQSRALVERRLPSAHGTRSTLTPAAARTVHAPHGVHEEGRQAQHRHEPEAARLQAVVARSPLPRSRSTAPESWPAGAPRPPRGAAHPPPRPATSRILPYTNPGSR